MFLSGVRLSFRTLFNMKYVRFSNGSSVLFGHELTHRDMADRLEGMLGKAVSAGFSTSTGEPYGESISLNLRSSPADSFSIKWALGIDPDL